LQALPSAARPLSHPDSSELLRHRNFLCYFGGRLFSNFSRQIIAVAVGWQIYLLTNSAFHLGLVGLAQFLPALLLTFHGGHVADRHERKRIVQICQWVEGIAAAYLAWRSFTHTITVIDLYTAAVILGGAAAYERPAGAAMLPNLVTPAQLQQATAMSAGSLQVATIGGPALGGFLFAYSAGVTYAVIAVFWLLAGVFNGALPVQRAVSTNEAPTLRTLFAGVHFVRGNPTVLGTISLDLFAVLLGGATALLPIYAKDILHTGPWGLGLLRAAPAAGALVTTAILARRPLTRRVGMRMFQAVMVFGVTTVVFGLSHYMWLTLAALVLMGAADQISVVIRLSVVQLATPDEMRGRVSAINFLFVNASNQLGEFESGLTASWWGAVPATIVGGVGSVVIALLWMRLFPALRNVEKLA
jgi:MFS family permease